MKIMINYVSKQMTDVKLWLLYSSTWNYLIMLKKGHLQNVFTNHIYLIYMYEQELALNNLQGLICHKTQTNQTITLSVTPKKWLWV